MYLGIIVSKTNCDNDLKRQMRKYYANANILLRKFSYCSPDVKCCMFKSYCASKNCCFANYVFKSDFCTIFHCEDLIFCSLSMY